MDEDRLKRHDLSDGEWARLEPVLPRHPRQGHRWNDHRLVIDGIFFRPRTGCPWRDLPERFGNWKTVYNRHRRWSGDGTWEMILDRLRAGCDQGAGRGWMVAVDALLPRGAKPLATTLGGLSVGVLGVVFLVYPAAVHEGFGGRTLLGFLLLQLAAAAFVTGALLQKRVATKVEPLVIGALQQFAAGLAAFVPAALFEKAPHHLALRPVVALVYLITIGSIVGYTAFIYAMAHLPVAVVSIYMFVNPVVAVFLGYLFFREPFGYRAALAMLIIFAGIALVRRSETTGRTSGLWGRPAGC